MWFKYKCLIDNTPFGIMIGWVSALVLVMAGYVSPDGFWRDYGPAIVTTTGALLGALLATAAVLAQIEAQHEIEERRRERRLIAAKAALPFTLSDWSTRIVHTMRALNHMLLTQSEEGLTNSPSELFMIPQEITSSITENIEAADLEDAKRLANLLSHYQVLQHRIQSTDYSTSGWEQVYHRIGECFVLRGLIQDCFEFARGEGAHIPSSLSRVNFSNQAYFVFDEPFSRHLEDFLRAYGSDGDLEFFSAVEVASPI